MTRLFTPLTVRGVTFRNRAWVSPMCQYSSHDGCPQPWHLVHLGSFAIGGAGLVMQEATAVSPEGRISSGDAGIWTDEQTAGYRGITRFIHEQGATVGIQLSHSGRKGSTAKPWDSPDDGSRAVWEPVAPSAMAFGKNRLPKELTKPEISEIVQSFGAAAQRAHDAEFDVLELHGAHGYLIHQFLSPLSNLRTDEYGGDLWGRARVLFEVAARVREVWPEKKPMFVRLSATDWLEGGWTLEETIEIIRKLMSLGIDVIDVSSGGLDPNQQIVVGPSYQVSFANAVRQATGVLTGAVGQITGPSQAETILALGAADAIFMGRELLRNPHWPLNAALELGAEIEWPPQYARAGPLHR
jgi:2,4-dienoyl-CoA reductase-like NADH-dependent reductase (Old Yellow Enzyme family)